MAQDYLAVMVSLVASEQAFWAAGITISKCHNHLDANIIKVLQSLKSLNGQDLISRVSPNVMDEEKLLNNADCQQVKQSTLQCIYLSIPTKPQACRLLLA
jgi:hypothetical protein